MAENPEKIRFIPLSGNHSGNSEVVRVRVVPEIKPSALGRVDGTLIRAATVKEVNFFGQKEALN